MTPLDDRLDDAIRDAMAELAGAAPLPTPADELGDHRGRRAASRPLRGAMVGAALALAGLVAFVIGAGDSPTSRAPVSSDGPAVTDPQAPSPQSMPTDPDAPPPTDALVSDDATGTTDFVYAPMVLPDGWRVWDATQVVVTNTRSIHEQAFGVRSPASGRVERGFMVTISDRVDSAAVPNETVRGLPALWLRDAGTAPPDDDELYWLEGDHLLRAVARGMSRDELVAALDGLRWRGDGGSFDPDRLAPDLPLLAEESTQQGQVRTMSVMWLSPDDGPVFEPYDPTSPEAVWAVQRAVRVTIGDTISGGARVATALFGERTDTGALVRDDGELGPTVTAVLPGGPIAGVYLDEHTSVATARQILDGIRPTPTDDFSHLLAAGRTATFALPVATAGTIDGSDITIEGRGDDPVHPVAVCLTIDEAQTCRLALGLNPYGPGGIGLATTITIGDRWFMVGAQPADAPELRVVAWRDGIAEPLDVAANPPYPVRSSIVGATRLWLVEVPTGVDLISVLHQTDDGLRWATTTPGTPTFARPPW